MPPRKAKRPPRKVASGPITFDEEGDLRLQVGEKKRVFVVCSRSLARASKPLRVMLYGGFAEAKHRKMDPNWTVELPEDDSEALIMVLHILHGHFTAIPDAVSRDELYQITILTDKYDMTEVLKPWAQKWVEPFLCEKSIPAKKGDEVLLWIAWELGHRTLYMEILVWLIEHCILDKDDRLCSPFGMPLEGNIYIESLGVPGKHLCPVGPNCYLVTS